MNYCQTCAKPAAILAHQVRDLGIEFIVCVECAQEYRSNNFDKFIASVLKECI